jgi:hypothetical protein
MKRESFPDAPMIRRWAVQAEVAEKTLRRYLAAEPVRPLSQLRIERAGRALGLTSPNTTNGNAAADTAAQPTSTGADLGDPDHARS